MDDLGFVQNCVKGDSVSWDEFVDKYSRLIYNYIHAVSKIKGSQLTRENIDDLFQEVFILLRRDNFKKLKSFKAKNGCSLATWLRQVVVNFTIDYLRRQKPAVSLDEERGDGLRLGDLIADEDPSIRDNLFLEEKTSSLKKCIEGLDEDDKYFIELNINQGLLPEELKAVFRISRGAVDMRKLRIIERLRDCFKAKGFALDF